MDIKRKLGRVISALLAASSVVGQAGASPAPKRRPKSAPADMNNKNVKKKATPDKGPFWKHLHENPHNWVHLGLGLTAGGLGSFWLYNKLKSVKGGVEKFSEMLSLVHGDKAYSSLFGCVGSLLKNDGKTVSKLFGKIPLVLSYKLVDLADGDIADVVKGFECKGVKDFKGATKVKTPEACSASGESTQEIKDNTDIFPSGDFAIKGNSNYGAFLLNMSKIPAVKFEIGNGVQAIAELLLRKAFLDVCVAKKLVVEDNLMSINISNGRALVLGDEDFVSYLDSYALKKDKNNGGKVEEVWNKVKGFSDLLLEIIKSKSGVKKPE